MEKACVHHTAHARGPSCKKCSCHLQTYAGPLRAGGGGASTPRQMARGPITRTWRNDTKGNIHNAQTPAKKNTDKQLSDHPPSSLRKNTTPPNNIRTTPLPRKTKPKKTFGQPPGKTKPTTNRKVAKISVFPSEKVATKCQKRRSGKVATPTPLHRM